jgi:hypothetical protein
LLVRIARRSRAMARPELTGMAGEPRAPSAGVTSAPIKARDEDLQREVESFLARKRGEPC